MQVIEKIVRKYFSGRGERLEFDETVWCNFYTSLIG